MAQPNNLRVAPAVGCSAPSSGSGLSMEAGLQYSGAWNQLKDTIQEPGGAGLPRAASHQRHERSGKHAHRWYLISQPLLYEIQLDWAIIPCNWHWLCFYSCSFFFFFFFFNDFYWQVFGVFSTHPFRVSEHYYGTGETFLYTFSPEIKVRIQPCKWSSLGQHLYRRAGQIWFFSYLLICVCFLSLRKSSRNWCSAAAFMFCFCLC